MLPNLPQTLIAFWGVLKAVAVVTMINPHLMEKEIVHLVNDSGLKHTITFGMCWPKFEKLLDQIAVDGFFVTFVAEELSFPLNLDLRFKSWRQHTTRNVPFDGARVLPSRPCLPGANA